MRRVCEWQGKTDDSPIPPRVYDRIYRKHEGRCAKCTRFLERGKWALDHIEALINGGQHRESNLQPLCKVPCHSDKTREDVAMKSKTYARRTKHIGIRKATRPMPGGRRSRWKKKLDGTVVPRCR